MKEALKILIPMGGFGARLRPLTWSRPKPLVALAGKTVLDHLLETLVTVPDFAATELIFSINAQVEAQVRDHIQRHYPDWKVRYPIDRAMRGQSDAFWQARELLGGPLLVIFADTIIETDFSFLSSETADGVIWVKPVPDPRRFGVTLCDEQGWIMELIEKPGEMSNNLAVVGCYYFRDSSALLSAIGEQIEKERYLKGEFYLADAINILLREGARMRTEKVNVWLDAGTPEALLDTNRYLLDHRHATQGKLTQVENTVIIPPVNIHPTAHVVNSVIGPHVSIGEEAAVEGSLLQDSVISPFARVTHSHLTASLVGQNVTVKGYTGRLNLGDNSEVMG